MPKTAKSTLIAKLGSAGAKAVKAAAKKEIDYGNAGEMPGGVDDGIAAVTKCYFAPFKSGENKGELYFRAEAVCVTPKSIPHPDDPEATLKVEGRTTYIQEPLHETPGRKRESVEDHVDFVVNQMRLMGADGDDLSVETLEATAEALQEAGIHIGFRTWKPPVATEGPFKGRPSRVIHTWTGACDVAETDEESDDEIVDESEDDEDDTVEDVEKEDEEDVEDEDEGAENAEESVLGDDLDELAEAADGGDEEASEKLADLASEAGIPKKTANATESWAALASLISDAQAEAEEEPDDDEAADGEDEEWEPQAEEIYLFKPPKKRKAIECEVTAVFGKSKKVNLKACDSGVTYRSVTWDKLESGE